MTVTINIPSDAESRLQREAVRAGIPVPALIEQIVAERFSPLDIDAFFQTMASVGKLPVLAPDATKRSAIYSEGE